MNDNNTEVVTEKKAKVAQQLTAGEMLRLARTGGRRKREIQTFAKLLCIREEFLQALEDGNYEQIPQVVYVLGFARNYAMELGIDPDEIVNKIKQELGLPAQNALHDDSENKDTGKELCVQRGDAKVVEPVSNPITKRLKRNLKLIISLVASVLVLFAIVITVILVSVNKKNDVQTKLEIAVEEPKYRTPVRERFEQQNLTPNSIILQANQESWVKIEDGRGNTVFSRVLVPGDVYFVPAGDSYKGVFGNAGGIDVWVGDKLTPKVGPEHVRKAVVLDSAQLLKGTENTDKNAVKQTNLVKSVSANDYKLAE